MDQSYKIIDVIICEIISEIINVIIRVRYKKKWKNNSVNLLGKRIPISIKGMLQNLQAMWGVAGQGEADYPQVE
jgi:hypothetical protein